MHELAITEGIIKLVSDESEKQGFRKCLGITLAIGDFSGIVPECVSDFFPLAAKGTIAEGASLTFTKSPDAFRCYVEYLTVE